LPNSKIIRTTPEAQGELHWNPPRGTLGELVFSSVSRHVFQHAVRPVVTVPAGWEPAPRDETDPAQ